MTKKILILLTISLTICANLSTQLPSVYNFPTIPEKIESSDELIRFINELSKFYSGPRPRYT